jgi:putative photosynthetic complex assembly protein
MSIVKPVPTVQRQPWLVWMALLMVALIVAGVAWQRQQPAPQESLGQLRWQLSLRFEDRPNGDVAVIDASKQTEIALLQGEHGFARGALRTLARERMRRDLGPQTPFELSAYQDGKLVLRDPATGERIHLESFGAGNAAVFAQLHRVGLPPSSQGVKP